MSKPIKTSHCWESGCRGIATQWAAGRLGASCHKVKGLSKIKEKAGRGIPASLMFRGLLIDFRTYSAAILAFKRDEQREA